MNILDIMERHDHMIKLLEQVAQELSELTHALVTDTAELSVRTAKLEDSIKVLNSG